MSTQTTSKAKARKKAGKALSKKQYRILAGIDKATKKLFQLTESKRNIINPLT